MAVCGRVGCVGGGGRGRGSARFSWIGREELSQQTPAHM